MPEPVLPRIASGDSSAIDECLQRYGGLVWSLARRLSASVVDAEDAVQEIFIDLWRSAGRYRADITDEATFVAVLARRRLIDRQRKQARTTETRYLDESVIEKTITLDSPRMEISEEASKAAACLEGLRKDERQVIELSVYHGMPQSKIAERTGLPLGTVKTHARRGLLQLRDCMEVKSHQRPKGVASR